MRAMWTCIACGATSEAKKPSLCTCGIESSWVAQQAGSSARARKASELDLSAPELESSGEPAVDRVLGGGFSRPACVLVSGAAGSGKSRCVSRWSASVGPALVLSLEMPARLWVMFAQSAGADLERLFVLDELDGWRAEAERLRVGCVLLDSVSVSARPVALVRALGEWAGACNGIAFAIAHENSRRQVLGPRALQHWPDVVLRMSGNRKGSSVLTVRKNRFAPSPQTCTVNLSRRTLKS